MRSNNIHLDHRDDSVHCVGDAGSAGRAGTVSSAVTEERRSLYGHRPRTCRRDAW